MMLFFMGARFSRSVHTSPPTFQFIKNVYKEIGYRAPFTENEKKRAIDKLNNLNEKELNHYTSKKFSKLLYGHRAKHGDFDCIEQLLDLPKVEAHQLEKICENLLKDLSMSKEENVMAERSKTNKPLFSKGIIPKPDIKEWEMLQNPTVLGITVSIQGISYTKIDSSRNLHGWAAFEGIENPRNHMAFQHRELYSFTSNIVNNLPGADYCIFEELLPILPQDPYIKQKANLIKLRSTIMTLMMMRNDGGSVRMHTIKPNVLDTLFSLKDEPNNYHASVANILSNRTPSEEYPFNIQNEISDSALNVFNDHKDLITRSLLKSLAFNYLCLEVEASL